MKKSLKIIGIILGILVVVGICLGNTIYGYYDSNMEMRRRCYDLSYQESEKTGSIFYQMHTGSRTRVCNQYSSCITWKKIFSGIGPKTQVSDEILQNCMSDALKEEQGY